MSDAATHTVGESQTVARDLVVAQLGGCNLSQILRLLPGTQVGPHALRTSTISLISAPLGPEHFRVPSCPLKAKFVAEDFGKAYAQRLFDGEWDVLFLDLLRDYLTGAIEVGGTYVSEINQWVHGEPLEHADLFLTPWRKIDWRSEGFFDLWSRSAWDLYHTHLKRHLDAGRRIVVHELLPYSASYVREQLALVPCPGGRERECTPILRRMYAFLLELDPRIELLRIEDEYALGAYDTENGPLDFHMIADYSARAAELMGERLGLPAGATAARISAYRLKETRRRYADFFEIERAFHHRGAVAAIEHQATQSQLEAATASAASLQSDLATARTALDSMQGLREAQSEAIAALTRRLETEIERADDLRRAFQVQERDLRAQIVARENAFATLVRERDELMDRFREHIGHYDALRDELDRRTAADDETYEQVLLLAGRIRSFADRWSSLPASGQADNIQAARALHELSSALLNAKAAVGGLSGIAAGLDAPAAPGLVAPTPQLAQ